MPHPEPKLRENPDLFDNVTLFSSRKHTGIRRGIFITATIFTFALTSITPLLGSFATAIITDRNVGEILLLREFANLTGALLGSLVLFFLTGFPRIDLRRSRDVVAVAFVVSIVLTLVRLVLQPLIGLNSGALGQNWFLLEVATSLFFALLLSTVMLLVAQRYTLVDAQVILRDEARRALEEDHESLRVRVFDHLHGTVQSELLVTRIRLLDIARGIQDEAVAAAIVKEAGNINRIHELEIRRLAHVMVASGIDVSLSEALRQLSLSIEGLCDVSIEIYEDFTDFDLSLVGDARATIRLAIFRIIEECVNNALRHGNARNIKIRLGAEVRPHGHNVFIHVSNDGILPTDEPRDGAGLRVMRARASIFNGNVITKAVNGVFTVDTALDIRG
jgi:signal transduction histidine kinase